MKIEIKNNYQYPKAIPHKPVFKGYFACPIKELHIQPNFQKRFPTMLSELNKKCGKYFKVVVQLTNGITSDVNRLDLKESNCIEGSTKFCWGQDNKLFFEDNSLGILMKNQKPSGAKSLAGHLGLKSVLINSNVEGGNCFLGKKLNGENFALVGVDALHKSNKAEVAKSIKVKPENLYVISQPDFHIDMVVRPLVYPYVLVGDHKLASKMADKNSLNKFQRTQLNQLEKSREETIKYCEYASVDKVVSELEKQGFIPIRVPGMVGRNKANFMNAIVHQEPNGDLIYITNKTHLDKKVGLNFEKMFEQDLKSKAPNVKEVVFVDGDGLLQDNLAIGNGENGGGIHCMSSENPDFEKWNEFLKNRDYAAT